MTLGFKGPAAGGFCSSETCGQPSDHHLQKWTALSVQWLVGQVLAQAGAARRPVRRPAGWLLGRGPMRVCGGRPWAAFSRGPKRKGSAQYVL
jgi:hypothetical protein